MNLTGVTTLLVGTRHGFAQRSATDAHPSGEPRWTTLADMTEPTQHHVAQEPPLVPASRRNDGSDGLEHAQPGSDRPTLCGIPAEQVSLYRHPFFPNRGDACPLCAERVWRLDPSAPNSDYVGMVRVGDAPDQRMSLRASSAREARELLRMRFGETSVVSVWKDDAANRS